MNQPIPYAEREEQSVISILLLRPELAMESNLNAADFYRPVHQRIFQSIASQSGTFDFFAVCDVLGNEMTQDALRELMLDAVPVVSNLESYVNAMKEARLRRDTIAAAATITDKGYENAAEAIQAMSEASQSLADRDLSGATSVPMFDFLSHARNSTQSEWLISGLLRRDWRIILAGAEGVGKMVLMRQLGALAACGRDVFRPDDPAFAFPKRRVLVVDTENTANTILSQMELVAPSINWAAETRDTLNIWHRPQGINLGSAEDRGDLESVVRDFQPDIMLAGPIYKLFQRDPRLDMEAATMPLLNTLDYLRTRYGFALILEHHLAKGDPSTRSANPFGSSALMRWPEVGMSIMPRDDETGKFPLVRFRGSRSPEQWPFSLIRSRWGSTAWDGDYGSLSGIDRRVPVSDWMPSGPTFTPNVAESDTQAPISEHQEQF